MKRYLLALFLLGLISTQSVAQQKQVPLGPPVPDLSKIVPSEQSGPPPMPLQVVPATQQFRHYNRITYVLDVSCSMSGALVNAISVVDVFASDSFKASVITFSDTHYQWEGVPCEHKKEKKNHTKNCLPPGWVWMPKHRKQLFRHLKAFSGEGGTNPASALEHAIRTAPDETLIVFISDGAFSIRDGIIGGERVRGAASVIRAAQVWRRKEKLAPVQILIWATSEADSKRETLVELAKLGGGGLWRADVRRSGPW